MKNNGFDMSQLQVGGAPLVLPFAIVDIVGANVGDVNGSLLASITVQTDKGDRLLLGLTVPMLDALADTVRKVRETIDAQGVERTIAFQPIHTATVGVQEVEGRPLVALLLDKSLPSAQAFLMPGQNAREVGKRLSAVGREVMSARAPVAPDDSE
jgi:hypothetical protein